MSVWVIIPVKPLNRAKSRLAPALSQVDREQLAEQMLRHVLKTVRDTPEVFGTLVISRDPHALVIAREYGAKTLQEASGSELNDALMRATQVIISWRVEAVLILPADLPVIAPEDIREIVRLGERYNTVVLATDEHENGTNALFSRPPGLLAYHYGDGSFRRHMAVAEQQGVTVKRYHSARLALDVDVPSDLEELYALQGRGKADAVVLPDGDQTAWPLEG